MKLEKLPEIYQSRRGDYQLVKIDNPMVWIPTPLGDSEREIDVMAEVKYAQWGKLVDHKYWENEPIEFVKQYEEFYVELFDLQWLHSREDRHNVVVNRDCCLTLVQYHHGTLYAYSRSTDMRNGYHSDKLILEHLAEVINEKRPDCPVLMISWYLAVPHVYVEKGIARLLEVKK